MFLFTYATIGLLEVAHTYWLIRHDNVPEEMRKRGNPPLTMVQFLVFTFLFWPLLLACGIFLKSNKK